MVKDRNYPHDSEYERSGFEKRLVELGIRQILARVKHPQTNSKLERIHGEIQRKLPEFEAILIRTSEPIDLFMKWYNYERPHMSFDYDRLETPCEALQRKIPLPAPSSWMSKPKRSMLWNEGGRVCPEFVRTYSGVETYLRNIAAEWKSPQRSSPSPNRRKCLES